MPKRRPVAVGSTYGRLTVAESGLRIGKSYAARVCCSCGNELIVREASLREGNTASCGCLQREYVSGGDARRRHNHSAQNAISPTYRSWVSMKARCTNPKLRAYPRYGGRGISVCPGWLRSFDQFLADMGVKPDGQSLDRIDNDGNYEPGNCRWADRRTQAENTSQVILVALGGRQMSFSMACREVGRNPATVHEWMTKRGQTHQDAIDHYLSLRRREASPIFPA